jgi:hypothetical protein
MRVGLELEAGTGGGTLDHPGKARGRKRGTALADVQPSATACIFWLKNRRKDLWRERPEADPTLPYDPNESFEDIRDELLQDMAAAGLVRLLDWEVSMDCETLFS